MPQKNPIAGPDHNPTELRAVRFSEVSLEPEAPGIESRAIEVSGTRWATVHYEPGVLRQEWCDGGHSGFVVEGSIQYEFRDGRDTVQLSKGDGFTLPEGQESAHRGQAGEDGARLFIIDRPG